MCGELEGAIHTPIHAGEVGVPGTGRSSRFPLGLGILGERGDGGTEGRRPGTSEGRRAGRTMPAPPGGDLIPKPVAEAPHVCPWSSCLERPRVVPKRLHPRAGRRRGGPSLCPAFLSVPVVHRRLRSRGNPLAPHPGPGPSPRPLPLGLSCSVSRSTSHRLPIIGST